MVTLNSLLLYFWTYSPFLHVLSGDDHNRILWVEYAYNIVSMYYKVTHGHAMHAENLASQCVRFRYMHMATVVVQRIKLG